MQFQKKNNLWGWGIFSISLIVYLVTLEPTLSLWDCGEFLVSAHKLEISHSPGAPLFMLLGRLFSILSFGNNELVAPMINSLSAISSAATVMLLFWISVWIMRKIAHSKEQTVLFSSAIGALAFAFTDSFWFSAVEAEVYALSSLFVALVLWCATRWERENDRSLANRWIVLIFFLTGLSIGVHLLNLLVLPTIALIIYYKTQKPTATGTIAVLTGSTIFVLFLMKVFIPGLFVMAGPFELMAVNSLGLPVNTGLFIYGAIIVLILIFGLIYSHKKEKQLLNLALNSLMFLMIGYTSYFASFIRSSANPPIDQGNPETTFELINYLNRESYGSRPIFYGETYGSVAKEYNERVSYQYDGEKYYPTQLNPDVEYAKGTTSFFPRLSSKTPEHMQAYARWTPMKGQKVSYKSRNSVMEQTTIPTLKENLTYFIRYQLGHMYLRYFMWNFAGRQNDIQGYGDIQHGNWQSGISAIDSVRLGSPEYLPSELKENKGRNSYYFLPLILGIIGLVFHFKKEQQTFLGQLILFGIMSLGLVVYLNEIPVTPRERDYVFVSSFFVFCLWIGLGTMAIIQFIESKTDKKWAIYPATLIALLAGPGILLHQNFDDHNRADRYTARDIARNYLMCCEPNAILFTHADNDTYPLWYCQEVEGIRQDVRVIVMPYLRANWYMKQINHKIYNNEGVKLTIPLDKYASSDVDYLPVVPRVEGERNMKQVLDFVASDSSRTKVELQSRKKIDFIPVSKMHIAIGDDTIPVKLSKHLMRDEIALWDIISSNINERPIYFTSAADPIQYGLRNYLRYDGMVYKLSPEFSDGKIFQDMGKVETDILYTNLMEKCTWENMEEDDIYFDWHHRRLFASAQIRMAFYKLAKALIKDNQSKKALQVIEKAESIIPLNRLSIDYFSVLLCKLYFDIGEIEKGKKRLTILTNNIKEWMEYYNEIQKSGKANMTEEMQRKAQLYHLLMEGIK